MKKHPLKFWRDGESKILYRIVRTSDADIHVEKETQLGKWKIANKYETVRVLSKSFLSLMDLIQAAQFEFDEWVHDTKITNDPIAEWMDKHEDELKQYAGQVVAVHPTKGVLAHGKEYKDLDIALNTLSKKDAQKTAITSIPWYALNYKKENKEDDVT